MDVRTLFDSSGVVRLSQTCCNKRFQESLLVVLLDPHTFSHISAPVSTSLDSSRNSEARCESNSVRLHFLEMISSAAFLLAALVSSNKELRSADNGLQPLKDCFGVPPLARPPCLTSAFELLHPQRLAAFLCVVTTKLLLHLEKLIFGTVDETNL